jgi:hypothetical protein
VVREERKVFKTAPLNLFIKVATVFAVGTYAWMLRDAYEDIVVLREPGAAYEYGGFGVLFTLILLLCGVLAPRRYVVGRDWLVIRKALWSVCIPYREILSVEIKEKVIPRFYVGIGGLFSLCGRVYAESGDGKEWVRMHATNWKRMVRIKTRSGDPYYLSPADPEKFVAALKEHLGEKER